MLDGSTQDSKGDRMTHSEELGGEQNEQVVRRLYEEVFGLGRLELADQLIHPACRDLHDSQDRRGPDRVEVATMLRNAFPDQRWEIQQLVADGDRIAMYCTWTGTHDGAFMGIPPTRRQASVPHMYLFRLKSGQVVEYAAVRDDLGMMQQLGLIPARGEKHERGQPAAA
jgi:predicted ester cyclase